MRQAVNMNPPAWQGCQVCRAARALQLALDALATFRVLGGAPECAGERLTAVKDASKVWEHAKTGRHTGVLHPPVVVG
jgi:hypothetical protein